MYRIMIVDDEPLILAGITSMLAWEEYECRIVGKCANGQLALEQMEELRPDIVITDIKMPAMDGITFLKEVRKNNSETAFILLTNMEEFSMAREVLSLGACAYLVKLELTEENLLEALGQAKNYCDARYSARERQTPILTEDEVARSYFQNIMLNDLEEMGEEIPGSIQNRFLEPVLVLINFNYRFQGFTEEFTRAGQKKVMTLAEDVIHEMVKGFFDSHCLVRREMNSFLLVLSASGMEDYKNDVQSMCEKIISVIKDYFEVTVSAAVSCKGEGLEEFGDLLYQTMNAMNNYYYDTSQPVLFYSEEFETGKGHNDQFNIRFMKKELIQMIRQNDNIMFMEMMEGIGELFREEKPSKLQAINACCNLYFYISSFFEDEEYDFPFSVNIMGELNRLNSLEDISDWVLWFGKQVSQLLSERKNSRGDKIMILVQNYVTDHYMEKLTLGQVAEALKISQGYLGTSFKRQYGVTFAEYVSQVKIEKAKELIATHQYLMYEISDMLGFDTQYYFSTVFKKVAGCSPKEYESELLKRNAEKL